MNKILNVGGGVLIILVAVPLMYNFTKLHFKFSQDQSEKSDNFSNSIPDGNSDKGVTIKPDIYYIIPDDYGSAQTLKDDYGYDDHLFIDYLKGKGFYIADKSKTNYPFSTYMIAAALNMDYLNSQTLPKIKNQPGRTVIDNVINDSKVIKFIKGQGYSFFNIGGWYNPLRYNDSADINFVYDTKLNFHEFTNTLIQNTIFYPLVLHYFGLSGRPNQIANTMYQFQALADMPNQISPKFVFVDLLSPHTPWDLNESCYITGHKKQDPNLVKFLPELTCTNKKLMSVVDTILKKSSTPPIIILQTDEGAKDIDNQAIKYPNTTGIKGGFKDASLETNLERVKILNAFYIPGDHSKMLYSEISPVNTFRLVFDEYFNAKLPLLQDKVYTFDNYDRLYKFIFNDITDRVKDK